MRDRIEDVWGERTPHARGSAWPARVDVVRCDGRLEPAAWDEALDLVVKWLRTRIRESSLQVLATG